MRQATGAMPSLTSHRGYLSTLSARSPGRRLMVLDDAETIARQARRRQASGRRRREALQVVGAGSLVLAVFALLAGVPAAVVGVALLLLATTLGLAWHQVRERQQVMRRRQVRATPGQGIGTPRPKGAFSITRHRSGAPVWVREQPTADQAA